MISDILGDLFRREIIPRVKFLREMTEQIILIDESNSMLKLLEEEERERSFAFMCPHCSSFMRIDRKDPTYDYCKSCGKGYMELFFGAQRIFKVDDGCVTWWVSATSGKEAVEQVIEYEQAAGCDLIKEDYWDEEDLDQLVCDINVYDAIHTTFWSDLTEKSTMWEEFQRDSSTRVIGCSEW